MKFVDRFLTNSGVLPFRSYSPSPPQVRIFFSSRDCLRTVVNRLFPPHGHPVDTHRLFCTPSIQSPIVLFVLPPLPRWFLSSPPLSGPFKFSPPDLARTSDLVLYSSYSGSPPPPPPRPVSRSSNIRPIPESYRSPKLAPLFAVLTTRPSPPTYKSDLLLYIALC